MANLSKTKTLFAFTSPRTIEKIIPEIGVLIDSFADKQWNTTTQIDFFKKLSSSGFYEGNQTPKNIPFAARDRITRAPKALGFVDLKPKIKLTKVGELLLSGIRTHDVIAKQLLKFQVPSPYHQIPASQNFNVRPYLELLRLTKELGNLSKTEIAIFFVQLTNYNYFNSVVTAIRKFRADSKKNASNRKAFIEKVFADEILKIYSSDINANDLKTRESGDSSLKKFITTKRSNLIDYADAFVRYLRATQLITFDRKTFRMIIAPSRVAEVDFILKNIENKAIVFKDEADYKDYLFNPSSILLLTDNKNYLEKRLRDLSVNIKKDAGIDYLKDLLEKSEQKMISVAIEKTEISLKHFKDFDDVMDIFSKITDKDVPDPPLYLEWNVWRSFVMMNYATDVVGNFKIDLDGIPLSTAGGNVADIEIQYDGFKVLVEVTMSTGQKQYEMENESVARHYGKVQNLTQEPVYCIFIAPKINEASLAYFYDKNIKAPKFYAGKTRIVPMNISQFVTFVTIARDKGFKHSSVLQTYLDSIITKNRSVDDEAIWSKHIHDTIPTWIS